MREKLISILEKACHKLYKEDKYLINVNVCV